ncbi:MAG: hypothetical protein JOZ73_14300 [Solirubrobacterales bacterium]|nr:hypothetical protein [Solirubrobacterales bacterium]
MAWVESISPSFKARHDSEQGDEASRVLYSLERAREELSQYFERTPGDLTVILHRGSLSLALSNPLVPMSWALTAPAARRYIAGWVGSSELHILDTPTLHGRASNVPGSREMLELTGAALYARRVIAENNGDLPRTITPTRIRLELRWAWLLEGGARWFSGQTDYAQPAIARRLREGRRPEFPPGLRDAALLGGTVIDLLARERGVPAAKEFVTQLHPQGARPALSKAFGGRPLVHTEGAWRSHLARLASAG